MTFGVFTGRCTTGTYAKTKQKSVGMVWGKTLKEDVEFFGPKKSYEIFENVSSFSFRFL